MNCKTIVHYSHGQLFHDTCIFLAERAVIDEGHELIPDRKWFEHKAFYAGIPDVYFRVQGSRRDERGRRVEVDYKCCLEIETKPTTATTLQKVKQFEETSLGHKVVIVPMNYYKGDGTVDDLYGFIRKYVPGREK